jgi:hypothetical protein
MLIYYCYWVFSGFRDAKSLGKFIFLVGGISHLPKARGFWDTQRRNLS